MTSTVQKIITFCEEAEHSAVSEKRPREDKRYKENPRKDPRKDHRGHARDAHTPYDPQRELNAQHPLMNTPIRLVSMNPHHFSLWGKSEHQTQLANYQHRMKSEKFESMTNIDILLKVQSLESNILMCILDKDQNGKFTRYFDMTLGTASPLRKTNHPVFHVKVYNLNSEREYYKILYYEKFYCVMPIYRLKNIISTANNLADFETGHNECSDKTVMQCHADCWIVAVTTLLIKLPWLLKHLDPIAKKWIREINQTMDSDVACASFPRCILEDYNKEAQVQLEMSSIQECAGYSFVLLKVVLERGYLKESFHFHCMITSIFTSTFIA